MASPAAIRESFEQDLDRAVSLLAAVNLPHFQAALICELAFLRCFLAWEVFLEETFYSYMLGKDSANGTRFQRFIQPEDSEHARKIIRSGRKFSAWADASEVVKRSRLFLVNGEPYSTALGSASGDLGDMGKVRNRIAHRSGTAKREFLELVRRKHGSVPPGTNAGRFLLGKNAGSNNNRFDEYISVLKTAGTQVVP